MTKTKSTQKILPKPSSPYSVFSRSTVGSWADLVAVIAGSGEENRASS